MTTQPIIVASYGGGVNSTAMLIGCVERDWKVDVILFADTGGEKPETYQFRREFNEWLISKQYPPIQVVRHAMVGDGKYRKAGEVVTLEQHCHDTGYLPSVAYGKRSCSIKFKVEPQNRFIDSLPSCQEAWGRGEKIRKLIGFDAGEWHRIRHDQDEKYVWEYPLVDWKWFRDDCLAAIKRIGMCPPPKSSCFFCPMMKKHEIRQLRLRHPDLLARAIDMEHKARNSKVAGLGIAWSWEKFSQSDAAQDPLFPDAFAEKPCVCLDGE